MAQLFPYKIKHQDRYDLKLPSVYKLHFGPKKYFIWKGKTLAGSVEQNCIDIFKLLWGNPKPEHAFTPMVAHIKHGRTMECIVEVVMQSALPGEILKAEKQLLTTGKEDPNCLNTIFQPHIPKWMAEELGPKAQVPRQNKPVRETFVPETNKVTQKEDRKPVATNTAPSKLNKLVNAYSKLHGGKTKDV
jgi:hypothetical protein